MKVDAAIVGGGPAGLASAIALARQGLSCVVLERQAFPVDKACGEGLLPAGVAALEALGARRYLDPAGCSKLVGIRFLQEDGAVAEAPLPGGLGIRRPVLANALKRRACEEGVELRERCAVRQHWRTSGGVSLETDEERIEAKVLIAADGLGSMVRRSEGLDRPVSGARRFGLRQHFARTPWTRLVEVHLAPELEAYVTPCGPAQVNIAFLWEDGRVAGPISFATLLRRFPLLAEKLAGVPTASQALGAGPLARASRSQVADRVVLIGDAAGYVDAITGEGLSMAFECAQELGRLLPEALLQGAGRATLLPYQHAFARAYRRYALVASGVLALARRPWARRRVIHSMARHPRLFSALVRWGL